MLFVEGGKIYYLHKHYTHLNRAAMLTGKVLLSKHNALKLKQGYHYLYEPI